MPRTWKVGDEVTFLHDSEHAWCAGSTGVIVELREEYKDTPADEYQVFYTSPNKDSSIRWWTTPDDVRLIRKKLLRRDNEPTIM